MAKRKPKMHILQRITVDVEQAVRRLGVAGSTFSDVLRIMVEVISADKELSQVIREKAADQFSKGSK